MKFDGIYCIVMLNKHIQFEKVAKDNYVGDKYYLIFMGLMILGTKNDTEP